MNRNSGDGEPNLGGSQQCTSEEKYAAEENCEIAPAKTFGREAPDISSLDFPSAANRVSTVDRVQL